mmetsp:Transcript_4700/g.11577  ORF Transcript_4700/g.11577 Transcript_4700/m.11577 type:complete len:232 (-) Transcript_4700:33-728(-)
MHVSAAAPASALKSTYLTYLLLDSTTSVVCVSSHSASEQCTRACAVSSRTMALSKRSSRLVDAPMVGHTLAAMLDRAPLTMSTVMSRRTSCCLTRGASALVGMNVGCCWCSASNRSYASPLTSLRNPTAVNQSIHTTTAPSVGAVERHPSRAHLQSTWCRVRSSACLVSAEESVPNVPGRCTFMLMVAVILPTVVKLPAGEEPGGPGAPRGAPGPPPTTAGACPPPPPPPP